MSPLHKTEQAVFDRLTWLEIRIVHELVETGGRNADIAKTVGCARQVVSNYLKFVYDKTGMGSRAELIVMVARHPELRAAIAEAAKRERPQCKLPRVRS